MNEISESSLYSMLMILKAIASAQIAAAGMTAENMQREKCGHSMAYTMDNFAQELDIMNKTIEAHRL